MGWNSFPAGPAEGVDREVAGDDDGHGIKNRAVDVASGRQDDVAQFVFSAVAQPEFAVDVLHHDDGAVNDDAEINGADGKEIGGFPRPMQKDEGEEESKRNGKRGDDRGAEADQKEDQDD